ncbi:MAG: hypothetical protein ABI772_01525 [Bacteroidota bacterium]
MHPASILKKNFQKERILIISYIFPPYPGIGGRRWTKFAKYFSKAGLEVHVICAKNVSEEQSVWLDDIVYDANIHVHQVNSFFPKIFTRTPEYPSGKIWYRLWRFFSSLLSKGYIYDRAIFSDRKFVAETERVINKFSIDKVIVTGAPFRLVYAITKAAGNWPGVDITADFRDPWTWEPAGDYQKLSKHRFDFEKQMEAYVIQNADRITVPSLSMKKHLDTTYPEYISKVMVLPHAWDEEEITGDEKNFNSQKRLIMFGTLYSNIDNAIRKVARELIREDGILTLDIFSDSTAYHDIFREEGAAHLVNYFPMLPSRQLYRRMKQYAAALIINNESDKDHVSTKFIELAASGTPVIYVAANGYAAEFVKYYQTGWHVTEDNLTGLFSELVGNNFWLPEAKLDIKNLSFSIVTERFLKAAYQIKLETVEQNQLTPNN